MNNNINLRNQQLQQRGTRRFLQGQKTISWKARGRFSPSIKIFDQALLLLTTALVCTPTNLPTTSAVTASVLAAATTVITAVLMLLPMPVFGMWMLSLCKIKTVHPFHIKVLLTGVQNVSSLSMLNHGTFLSLYFPSFPSFLASIFNFYFFCWICAYYHTFFHVICLPDSLTEWTTHSFTDLLTYWLPVWLPSSLPPQCVFVPPSYCFKMWKYNTRKISHQFSFFSSQAR